MYTSYKRNFNFLASDCSCAGLFESHFVKKNQIQVFSRRGQLKREREREGEREEREMVAS